MARIRTIKPEFPQSESMGRISRDARLCFIELWTVADDSGRLRGSSRMLASLLFPYDNDAPSLIDGWLVELEHEKCIHRYKAEGQTYLEIANWREHQKIDKPSPSHFPAFENIIEDSARPREDSSEDQGPRTKEGIKDQGEEPPAEAVASENAVAKPIEISDPPLAAPPSRRARKATGERDPLRDALAESFRAKVPEFASPAKENSNLVRLASAIRRKASAEALEPDASALGLLETFWRLHESGKPYYAAFTPSKMLSALEDLWAEWRKAAAANDTSWMERPA